MGSWFLNFKINKEKYWMIYNKKNTKIKINLISSFWEKNFLFRKLIHINDDQGFLIKNAKGFNTIKFNNNYDIVFLNCHFKVLKIIYLKQNEISPYIKNSYYCFILKAGTINLLEIKIDDFLKIKPRKNSQLFE